MNTFVALDFETANRNPSSVCSIGLVFVDNAEITRTYYRLIKPYPNFYNYFNTKIHGITRHDTATESLFPEIWDEVKPQIGDLPIVAHNSPFDEGCLHAVLAAYKLPLHTNKFFCTCRRARKVFPNLPNHRLETVAQHIGFDLENHHNALADAEACAHIALQLF